MAAGAGQRARIRAGPGRDPGGRRKAPDRRIPAQGTAVQLARRRAPARDRQVRRKRRMGCAARRMAADLQGRLLGIASGARDRLARRAPDHRRKDLRPDPRPPRLPRREGRGPEKGQQHPVPPCVLLLRLPAQHLDQGTGRQPGAGRHRLPRDGDLDLPGDEQADHPHGRRRRAVDRPGRVLEDPARVPEPGRRHLLPLGLPGDPRRRCGQRQHHLQDPVQRRGRDDRRPAGRRHHLGAADRPADGGRRHQAHRAGDRRPVALQRPLGAAGDRHAARPQGDGRDPARTARLRRRVGHHLRPDLRRRKAPPPQEGRVPRPCQARRHQRSRLRRLRRLRRAVELRVDPAEGNRIRPQAHHRPVVLQQGLLVHQGLLPELRHRRRRHAEEIEDRRRQEERRRRLRRAAGADAAIGRAAVQHPDQRHRRHRRDYRRRADGHGRPPRKQGRVGAGHDRHVAEKRLGHLARQDRQDARPTCARSASPPAKRT